MAKVGAPYKEGLNYYVCSPEDVIIKKELDMLFGYLGSTVYDRIMSCIYLEKGYYFQYAETDLLPTCNKLATAYGFLLMKLGIDSRSKPKVLEIVQYLVERKGIFDANSFNEHFIFTSNRIQRYYFWVISRRIELIYNDKYLLAGVQDFINQIIEERAKSRKRVDHEEAEVLPEGYLEAIINSVKVPKAENQENGITVHINSENDDINRITDIGLNDNNNKQREAKRSEAENGNSIKFPSRTKVLPHENVSSSAKDAFKNEKVGRTPVAWRNVFIQNWEKFSEQTFAPSSAHNAQVNSIVGFAVGTVKKNLVKVGWTDENITEEVIVKPLEAIFERIFTTDVWRKNPKYIRQSVDLKNIENNWATIFNTAFPIAATQDKPAKPKFQKKNVAKSQRASFEDD
mgnify:FL=1